MYATTVVADRTIETVSVRDTPLRIVHDLNTKEKRRTRVVLLEGARYAAHLPGNHPNSREILRRMWNILSRLSHPGFPKAAYAWEDDRGFAGFAREFFPSHDEHWRAFFPNLTLRTLLFMGARLAFAAHHLHQKTAHALCDIVPRNIAFRERRYGWRPGFFDFDIATSFGEICGVRRDDAVQFMGSPPYITPEQTRGDPVGAWTDEFALAVTLMSIGLRTDGFAVPGEEVPQVLRRAAGGSASYPYWRLAEQSLPHSVCETFERALHPTPDRRFPDCLAFGLALHEHLRTLPAEALKRRLPKGRLSEDELVLAAYANHDSP